MLAEHLAERVAPNAEPPRRDGMWVVYWMRTAVRATENPALDVALSLGAALQVPVFVYHALDERYPYASDRHHTFILEGARDVQTACAARGIGYVFHLARPGHRGAHLLTLAGRACVVVTEDFPWQPMEQWAERVARATGTPVWRVDTACVVPFRRVGRAYDRAFAFRDATKEAFAARVHRPWDDVLPTGPSFVPDLPFTPVDLRHADIPTLVASCAIDHGVGPVHHTPGGTDAGMVRWTAFVEHGLGRYATERSNPLKPAGASRLSAYLHYGMVSPLRVARDAMLHRTEGSAKFIDELHTWREVSWNLCAFTPAHERIHCLPAWARTTLSAHEHDARPALPSWETLARGETEDGFWNLLQTSLRIHGELHNQVRMTWGKALVQWTPNAQRCLDLLIDLNHRYALDGRDPGSYGGILWCLGLLDRPHSPEQPIFGTVRTRPTAVFSQRFDTVDYERRVRRPVRGVVEHVAVVGAGIAGCMLARTLADAGHRVSVFDRGQRPGGRMSIRRVHLDGAAPSLAMDHGAPLFSITDPRLLPFVHSWRHDGVVGDVHARIRRPSGNIDRIERLAGTPHMRALVDHLARGLTVRAACTITAIVGRAGSYRLVDAHGPIDETFTQVAVCLPAPQALPLVAPLSSRMAEALQTVQYAPRFVALASAEGPVFVEDIVVFDHPVLSIACRDDIKPGRVPGARWALHATTAWSREHVEDDAESCAAALVDALRQSDTTFMRKNGGVPAANLQHISGHRWLYATVEHPYPEPCLFDAELGLGVASDSFQSHVDEPRRGTTVSGKTDGAQSGGARADGVEAALLSARALAGRFLALKPVDDASLLSLSDEVRPAQMHMWPAMG